MTYVITEPCVGQKDASCVEVCPVDCIHPTPSKADFERANQLHIDPEECIDCDACADVCPVSACIPESQVPAEQQHFVGLNAAYFSTDRT